MNITQVLDFLLQYLSSFRIYPIFISELGLQIAKSGFEDRFRKVLMKQLRILSAMGIHATKMAEFESLGEGLFSMHVSGTDFNYRLLYFFLPDHQPAFLVSFEEREGKSKTDYSGYISLALDRKKEMEEDYKNGR